MMKWWGWGSVNKKYIIDDKPDLWPFMKRYCGIDSSMYQSPVDRNEIQIPPMMLNPQFVNELKNILNSEQYKTDDDSRLLHAYGKSFRDLLRARSGKIDRAPDMILYPRNAKDVANILKLANQHQVAIIPFGGGTNIVGGVEVDINLKGMAVTLDMQQMNRILDIDEDSMTATIEAGILGPELEAQLNAKGYSLGHFPDSFEFSTLGGWLATRSAGMQSDRYGKIEDMVVAIEMVTPIGTISTAAVPKAATGPDLNQIIVGSEGVLGIITQATMKIHPLQKSEYRGILFPDFAHGVQAIQQCMRNNCMPETMRLSNEDETALGFSLRGKSHSWLKKKITEWLMFYLKNIKKFDMEKMCLMIVGVEGDEQLIKKKRNQVFKIFRCFGGVDLGISVGKKWFAGKYDYPYLRDYFMDYGGMADVTESSFLWKNVISAHEDVKRKLKNYLQHSDVPGYVGCHLSHSYNAGACLYFTFAVKSKKNEMLEHYLQAKKISVDAVLANGGALSHHHAIGYEHQPWYANYMGDTALQALCALKKALDPNGICNPGKLLPAFPESSRHYWPIIAS